MKRRKLAQRVTSAVLSACMMFTLSSPALAESTSAFMELSADRGVSVLSEENSVGYGIYIGGTEVTSDNCNNLRGGIIYDHENNLLYRNGKIQGGKLEIDAPNTDIVLDGGDEIAVATQLIIKNARDVTVRSNKYAAIFSRDSISTINCTGKLTLISGENYVVNGGQYGGLTVENAGEVEISANNVSAVLGVLDITSTGDVKITNIGGNVSNKTLTISAQNVEITTNDNASYHESALSNDTSITASGNVSLNSKSGKTLGKLEVNRIGGPYVYFLSDDEDTEGIDGTVTPITAEIISGHDYLRIEDQIHKFQVAALLRKGRT